MNRRTALKYLNRAMAWTVALAAAWPVWSFVTWRGRRTRTVVFAPEELADHAYKDGVFMVSTDTGWQALSARCTHLCCLVSYDQARGVFRCPCHRSEFDSMGGVRRGPAPRGLDRLKMTVTDDGGMAVEVPV